MTRGDARRRRIVDILTAAEAPVAGAILGEQLGVSRQVIVQDIALLRSQGHAITTTHYGYQLDKPSRCTRLVKVRHTVEQIADELEAVVDLGGTVDDVLVNHRTYGQISARLDIASRRDIKRFVDDIASGKSSPLSTVTSGYHFHHISAASEELLDEIEQALADKGYIAEILSYEVGSIA